MRKERDPAYQAREAEITALQLKMLGERQQRQIAAAEAAFLRSTFGDALAAEGCDVAAEDDVAEGGDDEDGDEAYQRSGTARASAGRGSGVLQSLGGTGLDVLEMLDEEDMPFATELLDTQGVCMGGEWAGGGEGGAPSIFHA